MAAIFDKPQRDYVTLVCRLKGALEVCGLCTICTLIKVAANQTQTHSSQTRAMCNLALWCTSESEFESESSAISRQLKIKFIRFHAAVQTAFVVVLVVVAAPLLQHAEIV